MFGIRGKILLFAVIAWAFIFAAYGIYSYRERIEEARRMTLSSATLLAREITADMHLYNSAVVKKALDAGLSVETGYLEKERSIPVHAAFLREVARAVSAEGGYSVELKSLAPINPESAPRDAFQKEALDRLRKGEPRYSSFEDYRGKESLRFMVPHVAVSQVCIDCHNGNPASPRRDYALGDVMGGLEIVIPVEEEMLIAAADARRDIFYGFVVVFSMGLLGLAFLRRVITEPIGGVVDATSRLAGGDLTVELRVRSRDEMGRLSALTNEAAGNFRAMIGEIRSTSSEVSELSTRVRDITRRIAEGSKSSRQSMDVLASQLGETSEEVLNIVRAAGALSKSLEAGSSRALELGSGIGDMASGIEDVTASVSELARITRGMTASINEISGSVTGLSGAMSQVSNSMAHINAAIKAVEVNAGEASRFAEDTIKDAKRGLESVDATIQGMARIKGMTGESALVMDNLLSRINEVGKILDVISEVADETNLLAINAAIIAAQSGEYGKSFSVVANEIKDLAERTSAAAKEVTGIVRSVESEGAKAGDAMKKGIESVEEGVKLSTEAGQVLEKIVESAGKSTRSARDIAKGTQGQAEETRVVAESVQKVVEMSKRIAASTQDHARGSELVRRIVERVTEVTHRVLETSRAQRKAAEQVTSVMEEVRALADRINAVVKDEAKGMTRVIDAAQAAGSASGENERNTADVGRLVDELVRLNERLDEVVRRFKLG